MMKVKMKSCSDNIAVIPARRNSRRLRDKNLLTINSNSLIKRTADIAEQCGLFSSIIISTDIPENLLDIDCSRNTLYNRRPDRLCSSDTSTDAVIDYLIEQYEMVDDTVITLLQPTSPMRTVNDVKSAADLYKEKGIPVISALQLSDVYRTENGINTADDNGEMIMINGAIYIFSVNDFRKKQSIPVKDCAIFYMDYINSIDINYKYQYNAARILIENGYSHN